MITKNFLDMTKTNTKTPEQEQKLDSFLKNAVAAQILIVIEDGKINVSASSHIKEVVIINKDTKKGYLEKAEPFMNLSGIVRGIVKEW